MKQGTMEDKLVRFLFQSRLTSQTAMGVSPGERLMWRRLRMRLDAFFQNSIIK